MRGGGQVQETVEEAQATGQLRQIQEDLVPHSGQLYPPPELLGAAIVPHEEGGNRVLRLIYALQIISSYGGISDDDRCAPVDGGRFDSDPGCHICGFFTPQCVLGML